MSGTERIIALPQTSLVAECPVCHHEEHCDVLGGVADACGNSDCLCSVCPDCGGHDDIDGGRPCTRCGGEGVA